MLPTTSALFTIYLSCSCQLLQLYHHLALLLQPPRCPQCGLRSPSVPALLALLDTAIHYCLGLSPFFFPFLFSHPSPSSPFISLHLSCWLHPSVILHTKQRGRARGNPRCQKGGGQGDSTYHAVHPSSYSVCPASTGEEGIVTMAKINIMVQRMLNTHLFTIT